MSSTHRPEFHGQDAHATTCGKGNRPMNRRSFYLWFALVGIGLIGAGGGAARVLNLLSPNPTRSGMFGFSVSGVPDVNGDGRPDTVVGAVGEKPINDPFANLQGRAYILSGASGRVLWTLQSPTPEKEGAFGASVSGIPDLNADRRGDVVIGAPGEQPEGGRAAGRVYVFSGNMGTLLYSLQSPNIQAYGFFGGSVTGLADLDGDGLGDFAVGAPEETTYASGWGRVYLFSGGDGSLMRQIEAPWYVGGDVAFGSSIAQVPDVNNDGFNELIVGAPREDTTYVEAGAAYIFDGTDGSLLVKLVSPNPLDRGNFGWSVSGIPDVDGDGGGDVVVGTGNEGIAYVFNGSTGALLHALQSPSAQPASATGFSISVAGVGDIDGDRRGDVLVGAMIENGPTYSQEGHIYLFSGATGLLLQTVASPNPKQGGRFGSSVSGTSSAPARGHPGIIIGASDEDGGALESGRAYVFSINIRSSILHRGAAATAQPQTQNSSATQPATRRR